MRVARRTLLMEGIFGGLLGGTAFLAALCFVAAFINLPPGAPFLLIASLAAGPEAVTADPGASLILIGLGIHFGLSALFGLLYGAFTALLPRGLRDGRAFHAGAGMAYGAALWVINLLIVAPGYYPWFEIASAPAVLVIHAVFYGFPLSYWVVLRLRDAEVPGVHRVRHRLQTSTGEEEIFRFRRDLEVQRESAQAARVQSGGQPPLAKDESPPSR